MKIIPAISPINSNPAKGQPEKSTSAKSSARTPVMIMKAIDTLEDIKLNALWNMANPNSTNQMPSTIDKMVKPWVKNKIPTKIPMIPNTN